MNTRSAFVVVLMLASFAACGPAVTAPESGGSKLATVGGGGSGESGGGGGVSGDVARAIDDETQALAELDAQIDKTENDDTRAQLRADRVAGRSYLKDLKKCADGSVPCPPFDAPTVDTGAPITELATDACACRTRACVDQVLDSVDSAGDQTDDDGAAAETTARECIHARLGRAE